MIIKMLINYRIINYRIEAPERNDTRYSGYNRFVPFAQISADIHPGARVPGQYLEFRLPAPAVDNPRLNFLLAVASP